MLQLYTPSTIVVTLTNLTLVTSNGKLHHKLTACKDCHFWTFYVDGRVVSSPASHVMYARVRQ